MSRPPGVTFHSAIPNATKAYKHSRICSIFGRLVPKMDFGAKEQNSSDCKLYFDIHLAMVTIVHHSYFSILKLALSFVSEM